MAKKLIKRELATQEKVISDPIVPLGSLAYMRPGYLARSAWTEHVPFAFWLIEALRPSLFVELGTHWGLSYFAFCQAIDRLDPGAKAFAVDTWTGDEHSGKYDAEVFDGVRSYNDATYRHLSSLRKCTFDEAREYFLDGSVDLLHIDGLHTYEAVSHDFESWRSKMSARGVVIFHDTNVRQGGFGVFRLFNELKEKYPTFEFTHGHGLGIVGIGDEQTEKMRRLFDADKDAELRGDLHTLFSGLGRACLDSFRVQDANNTLTDVRRQLQGEVEKQRVAAEQAEAKAGTLEAQMKQATEVQSQNTTRKDSDARILEESITRLTQSLARAERELDVLRDEIRAKEENIVAAAMRERELGNKLAETRSGLAQRQHETDQYVGEVAELRRDLKFANSIISARDDIVSVLKEHNSHIVAELQEKGAAMAKVEERCQNILQEAEQKRAAVADELRKEKSQNEVAEELRRYEILTLTQLLREAESNALKQSEDVERAKREAQEKQAALSDELRKEKSRSEANEEQRRHEISNLTRLLKEAGSSGAGQSDESKQARREAEEKLAGIADELRLEKSRSAANEGQRHHEISTLTRLLKEAESSGTGQSEDLKRARRAAEDAFERLGKRNVRGPSETISGYASPAGLVLGRAILQMIELPRSRTLLPYKAQLKRKVELLRQTGAFDAEWYLNQYDDVAKSGIDPMEHYIKYGATEGRLPNGYL